MGLDLYGSGSLWGKGHCAAGVWLVGHRGHVQLRNQVTIGLVGTVTRCKYTCTYDNLKLQYGRRV